MKKKASQKKASASKKGGKKDQQKESEEIKDEQVALKETIKDFPPFDDFCEQLSTWKPMLESYIKKKQFQDTYNYVKQEYATRTCYPPPELIFNAFKQTPLSKLKVVIVGQDPYHQPGQAMGLCFSVPKTKQPPPSLINIYKCIANDKNFKNFKIPKHGDLTKWANQGVFLLNDLLSVVNSTPMAHKDSGWKNFTDEVINIINSKCNQIVFMLWGLPAQKKAKIVDEEKHCVLKTSHPSPMSAFNGFLTSQHFSKCNEYLKSVGKEEIDWSLE